MSEDASPVSALSERVESAGAEEPLHVHLRADESLLVVRGAVVLLSGGRRELVAAGETARIAAGAPHALAAVDGEATVLVWHVAPSEPRSSFELPPTAWPIFDGLGTLYLGANPIVRLVAPPAPDALRPEA